MQLADSLETIRHILRVKTRMVSFKNKNYRGQKEGTRSRMIIDRIHDKALAVAEKYRAARVAKSKLAVNSDWERTYLPLATADICGFQDPNKNKPHVGRQGIHKDDELEAVGIARAEEQATEEREMRGEAPADFDLTMDERTRHDSTGETRRTLSWIWTVEGINNIDTREPSDDVLQVEWCKSRARANRAKEEVLLLKEEMRRTLEFLKWRGRWWRSKPASWPETKELLEGVQAYAESQALLQENLHALFKKMWDTPLCDMPDGSSSTSRPDVDVHPTAANATNKNINDDADDDDDREDLFDDDEALFDDDDGLEDALDQDNLDLISAGVV